MQRQSLNVLFGQTREMSTSFQTRQLAQALEPWFKTEFLEIPRLFKSQKLANAHRLFMNNIRHRFWKPQSDYVLYGNDGVINLKHWEPMKTILYWYDCPWNWEERPPTDFTQGLRYKNLLNADYVFTVSRIQAELATRIRKSSNKVHYLPVGVNTKVFDPLKVNSNTQRLKLGLPKKTVIGYLGYLGFFEGKFAGQPLLDAAHKILKSTDVHFLVVGFGPGLEHWKKTVSEAGIEKHFTFTGYIEDSDVPACIDLMDITIDILEPGFHSLARSETKLKQYMAMGKACIATEIGENIVDLENGNCGVLVGHGDEPMAEAVIQLSKDPARRKVLGEKARLRACANYDWDVLARKMATAVLGRSP